MEKAVRCGYLFFRFTSAGKTCPMKKFVQLGGGHENGCPQLLVYEDERKSMAMSNCLCMVLGQEVEEAKGWQGEATWDRFSFKVVTRDYEYIFSAASERERDTWLEDVVRIFFRSPVDKTQDQGSATQSVIEYENPYKYMRKFLVTLDARTSKLLGASGCIMLSIEGFYLTATYVDGNRLGRFDICELRRYGFTDTTFHLSTGRKNMFGEGTYTFVTRQGQHIYTNWKDEVRLAKASGRTKPSPGEIEALQPDHDHPLFTKPGHTYEKNEDYVAKTWSSIGYSSLDSSDSSGDEETDPEKPKERSPGSAPPPPPPPPRRSQKALSWRESEPRRPRRSQKALSWRESEPRRPRPVVAESPQLARERAPTPTSPFREYEWQIKTMMVLELAKELCKGDRRRYCEVLNQFLERNGMTPLEWDSIFGSEGPLGFVPTGSTWDASSGSPRSSCE
ncbi:hypothetical protein C7M84_008071 [Penaeus vannamei]|uniref:PH domain-containing protein n=1 Tax=Penaeus vannamei TaxID=6689 RepID=A0A3R7M6R3_PENVA|nr:uncharacterized protein LOC113809437 [Penaeus vannamei]XP_027216843.1 uncharacterized protein LOC113809437 [Penaeus vannamei]XP_027216844.1 uncharacterized protein LOC113809437 [Penaeus vannamei]XP_027216845.1 uncharacterized protein LOC113809437 [Penaeus vannamei]ROT73499.1 hypothetical protein C7M84_008071 [Penaeus vannamei]